MLFDDLLLQRSGDSAVAGRFHGEAAAALGHGVGQDGFLAVGHELANIQLEVGSARRRLRRNRRDPWGRLSGGAVRRHRADREAALLTRAVEHVRAGGADAGEHARIDDAVPLGGQQQLDDLALDRFDLELGSPPRGVVLASSRERHRLGPGSQWGVVLEERLTLVKNCSGEPEDALVRADMVYSEGPCGGAVFSAGSITFCGSLLSNGGDNDVSRIVANVLNRFLDPTPFEMPA